MLNTRNKAKQLEWDTQEAISKAIQEWVEESNKRNVD